MGSRQLLVGQIILVKFYCLHRAASLALGNLGGRNPKAQPTAAGALYRCDEFRLRSQCTQIEKAVLLNFFRKVL
nr:MAG TPA_asm: hypothetical protein [Caudoviricetes sp.]